MKVIEGQSLFDLCIKQYGTLEALFAFTSENGLALDAELEGGQELQLPAFTPELTEDLLAALPKVKPDRNTVVSDGQNLLDVVLQETGSLEGLFEMAALNGLLISEELVAGQELRKTTEIKPDLVQYFASRKHRINTGANTAATSEPGEDLDGIFWVDGDGAYISDGDDNYILADR